MTDSLPKFSDRFRHILLLNPISVHKAVDIHQTLIPRDIGATNVPKQKHRLHVVDITVSVSNSDIQWIFRDWLYIKWIPRKELGMFFFFWNDESLVVCRVTGTL